MTCSNLGPFIDGELPAPDADAFREHLDSCASCQRNLHAYAQLTAQLSDTAIAAGIARLGHDVKPPPGWESQTMARIDAATRKRIDWSRVARVVALLVIMALFGADVALIWRVFHADECRHLSPSEIPADCVQSLHSSCDWSATCPASDPEMESEERSLIQQRSLIEERALLHGRER